MVYQFSFLSIFLQALRVIQWVWLGYDVLPHLPRPPHVRFACYHSHPEVPGPTVKKKKTDDVSFCNVVNLGFVCPFFGFYVSMDMIHPLLIYYLIKASTRTSVYCMGYFYFFFSVRKDRPGTFYEYVHVEWYGD